MLVKRLDYIMVISNPKILMFYENKGLLLSVLSQPGSNLSLYSETQLMEKCLSGTVPDVQQKEKGCSKLCASS